MKKILNELILKCTMGDRLIKQDELVNEYRNKCLKEVIKIKDISLEGKSPEFQRGHNEAILKIMEKI